MKSAQIRPTPQASRSSNGDDARWRAVLDRDARQDGKFFYAVCSTGVFCRPTCPSRRPRRGGVVFFATAVEAERAGFRACLRCRPLEGDRRAMLAEKLCRYIETHADEPLTLAVLGDYAGVTQFHLQRTFKRVMGVTPREYAAACRLRALKKNLRAGQSVTQQPFAIGHDSRHLWTQRPRRAHPLRDHQFGAGQSAAGGDGPRGLLPPVWGFRARPGDGPEPRVRRSGAVARRAGATPLAHFGHSLLAGRPAQPHPAFGRSGHGVPVAGLEASSNHSTGRHPILRASSGGGGPAKSGARSGPRVRQQCRGRRHPVSSRYSPGWHSGRIPRRVRAETKASVARTPAAQTPRRRASNPDRHRSVTKPR